MIHARRLIGHDPRPYIHIVQLSEMLYDIEVGPERFAFVIVFRKQGIQNERYLSVFEFWPSREG